MAAPASTGEAATTGTVPDAASGSADNGTPAPGNAEDKSLASAFGDKGANNTAGTEGQGTGGPTQTGEKAAGDTGTGSEAESKPPAWFEQLPKEMRDNPETVSKLAKYQKIGDMAKTIMELEGKAADNAADIPKTAEDYSFAKDKESGGDSLAQVAHRASLTAEQAETVYKSIKELGTARMQAMAQAQQRQLLETEAALKTEYGAKYAEKIELLTRGLDAAGPNVGNLLRQAGLAGNPEIVKAFIALGETTAESGSTRGNGAAGSPFVPTSEGGSLYKET